MIKIKLPLINLAIALLTIVRTAWMKESDLKKLNVIER